MRINIALLAAALIIGAAPVAASAGVTQIQANPEKPFKHRRSGLVVPAVAAGIPRTSVEQFDDKQLDFAAEFRSPDDKEITTIYVFRKVTGDVPLWFDRIQRTVEARDIFANPKIAIPVAAFTPAGQSNPRGLRVVYVPGAPPWTSSAAALTANGDWYVAVRASSQSLTPEQLLARVEQTFAAIKWPREKEATPNAYQVASCPDALPQGSDAEPAKDNGSAILLSALAGNVKGSSQVAAPRWCRDPYASAGIGVYRPNGATDRYFIAFQDAGRGMMVQADGLAALFAGANESTPLTYTVETIGIDRRIGFGSFKTLPSVAQAIWLNDHGKQTYSSSTWGKDKTIQIDPDALK